MSFIQHNRYVCRFAVTAKTDKPDKSSGLRLQLIRRHSGTAPGKRLPNQTVVRQARHHL